MAWKKQGVIFKPDGQAGWMNSHAQVPTPLVTDSAVRVYFCTRPEPGISLTTFFDLDPETLEHVEYLHEEPIVPLGKPGTFDEFGVMPSCVLEHDGRVLVYTTGWTRGVTVPYLNGVGLLISEDGGKTFERYSDGPLLRTTPHEPYSAMSPYVLRHGDSWHMWYSSGTDWVEVDGKYEPIYLIKYASSDDGLNWVQNDRLCIPPKTPGEANTRPTVHVADGVYHMWFCYRGSEGFRGGPASYRIGYAHSSDGIDWVRDDDRAGIEPSPEGWDSVMVAYPQVVETSKGLTMFYNGNGFGTSGIGYALWQDDKG